MNSLFKHGSFRFACLLLAATMLSITASPAAAVLVNKYTFNDGTATDLIGGQNGTLFGTNGSFSNGPMLGTTPTAPITSAEPANSTA